jgi:hypothetical protein
MLQKDWIRTERTRGSNSIKLSSIVIDTPALKVVLFKLHLELSSSSGLGSLVSEEWLGQ